MRVPTALRRLTGPLGLMFLTTAACAQDSSTADGWRWSGYWAAEGLGFMIEARRDDRRLQISPLDPRAAGLWSIRNGQIKGDSATIEAEYQGVTATVYIELTAVDTAIARTLSCQPDYHFICTLARNQQARFRRVASPDGE